MKNIEDQILKMIERAESILIMPSSPPDGDSLGSAVALYLALRKMGKTSTVVCADPVPDALLFLPMMNSISNEFSPSPDFIITLDTKNAELASLQSELKENKINIIITARKGRFSAENVSFSHGAHRYDLIITVDTAACQQLGRFYEDNVQLFRQIPVVNIDHHASNEQFGLINYVDVMSSATTELMLGLFEAMEEKEGHEIIDEDIATLLLAGIITDTGSFQNSNTNPRSFANSARLIKRGARQQEIIQHVFKTKQLSTLRLWGRILSNIKIDKEHRFLWSVITKKDLQETGSRADETGDIIDELMTNAPDTDIVLLLKEKDDGTLSGSLRTISDAVDASEIAGFWGGGGHAKAAGFRLENSAFSQNGQEIVERIREFQRRRLNLQPSENAAQPDLDSGTPADTASSFVRAATADTAEQNTGKAKKQSPSSDRTKSDSPAAALTSTDTAPKILSGRQQLEPGALYKFES